MFAARDAKLGRSTQAEDEHMCHKLFLLFLVIGLYITLYELEGVGGFGGHFQCEISNLSPF